MLRQLLKVPQSKLTDVVHPWWAICAAWQAKNKIVMPDDWPAICGHLHAKLAFASEVMRTLLKTDSYATPDALVYPLISAGLGLLLHAACLPEAVHMEQRGWVFQAAPEYQTPRRRRQRQQPY